MVATPITAYAACNALGDNADDILDALAAGRCGLAPVDETDGSTRHWGRANDPPVLPDAYAEYDSRAARLLGRVLGDLAEPVAVARQRWGSGRVALVLGVHGPDAGWLRGRDVPTSAEQLFARGPQGPMLFAQRVLGISGHAYCVSAEGAAGAAAIASGHRLIAAGLADAVVAGGVGVLSSVVDRAYTARRLLSAAPARPLSAARAGTSLGEGAAVVLLERQAEAFVELVGAAEAQETNAENTAPLQAMQSVLRKSGLEPAAVGFVQMLAPGTVTHDFTLTTAVRKCFGEAMPVSSLVGAAGWVVGAAGATELIVAAAALSRGSIPPTVGCDPVDGTLGVLPATSRRELEYDHAMVQATSLGGRSIALVVGARS